MTDWFFPGLHTLPHAVARDVSIHSGTFQSEPSNEAVLLDLQDALAFPGLINSHDHLDFNLFPSLGGTKFTNYLEWSRYIHQVHRDTIAEVLRIPHPIRVIWGVYKNLLGGVTTAVHHGPDLSFAVEPPIQIEQHGRNAIHSVEMEKWWMFKLTRPFSSRSPFVVHLAEGTDCRSGAEAMRLFRWNRLKRRLIAVHGIALTVSDMRHLEGLVWCPDSNQFLYGAGPDKALFECEIPVVFGTDSTLSSSWNLFDHLRMARQLDIVSPQRLFDMLTTCPAKLWRWPRKGQITPGFDGDLVIAERSQSDPWVSFFQLNPENMLLILHKGKMCLFDESLLTKLKPQMTEPFSKVKINRRVKFLKGDVDMVRSAIMHAHSSLHLPFEVER